MSDLPIELNQPSDIRRLARLSKDGEVRAHLLYSATPDMVFYEDASREPPERAYTRSTRGLSREAFLRRQIPGDLLLEGAYLLTLNWHSPSGWKDDAISKLGAIL